MRTNLRFFLVMFIGFMCLFIISRQVEAACRNPNLVIYDDTYIILAADSGIRTANHPLFSRAAASSGFIEMTWFGHAFFQIISSTGTRIITDPFRYMGFPIPEVWPDVVTVGKETRNHSNVALAKGNPLILRGQKSWGAEWGEINTRFRDVLIYNVPIHVRAPYEYIKGSAFVFEMDGLCICHTGDVGEPFNEDQLQLIGHIDVLLVPIGGTYSAGPEEAKQIVDQLKPKIVVPMHYWYQNVLDQFVDGPHRAKFLDTNTFMVSKNTLPPVTEIVVPKVVRQDRNDDF